MVSLVMGKSSYQQLSLLKLNQNDICGFLKVKIQTYSVHVHS